jgi:hypothetical protein
MNIKLRGKRYSFSVEIAPAVYAVVGLTAIALVVASGILFSERHPAPVIEITPHSVKLVPVTPKTPADVTERSVAQADYPVSEASAAERQPPQKPSSVTKRNGQSPGWYYQAAPEEQGDGEGRMIFIRKPCDPREVMPMACYYPQSERKRLPVYPN